MRPSLAFTSISQLIAFHESRGFNFFSKDSMRFFRSKVYDEIYGGCIFITSEQHVSYYPSYHKEPRKYTVRMIRADGTTDTLGEFQQYKSLRQARAAAEYQASLLPQNGTPE